MVRKLLKKEKKIGNAYELTFTILVPTPMFKKPKYKDSSLRFMEEMQQQIGMPSFRTS